MVLIILDGWGHRDAVAGNAIAAAAPRFMMSLARDWPSARLEASGESVGLPPGFIGNSEVGHLCLGAGRTVAQDLARIGAAIAKGDHRRNPAIVRALDRAAQPGAGLHLMGLLSDGGVHSHIGHLEAIVTLAAERRLPAVFVHPFLDGRDTPPRSALIYLRRLQDHLKTAGTGSIATVSGRYWAMDRDQRWDRTEKAWRALVRREGPRFADAAAAVEASYAAGKDDEFVVPSVLATGDAPVDAGEGGSAAAGTVRDGAVRDGDVVIFFNFRADRARQMTRALMEESFAGFAAPNRPRLADYVCFTAYDRTWSWPVAFPPRKPAGTIGEVVSRAGLPQLRIAETEKYAHVTYFFNGGEEAVFPGEERCLVPSARVATYDLKPEMSAPEVTAEVIRRIEAKPGQVVILNYANADMVGHTGRFEPTVEACRVVDRSVEAVVMTTLRLGGHAIVTSDHGNAEQMIDPRGGGPVTAHTMNPVPVHVVGTQAAGRRLRDGGRLADVAPTMLQILGLSPSQEMEGRSLILG
jgi:2,3-bisphosphoglycerate-independent phosphoglycerate mutase